MGEHIKKIHHIAPNETTFDGKHLDKDDLKKFASLRSLTKENRERLPFLNEKITATVP